MKHDKKSPGPKDEQFTKRKDGISSRGTVPASKGRVGKDEQFDDHHGATLNSGKKSSKSSGGTPGKFDGQKLHPAAAIMREVARALMKAPGPDQEYQGNEKVSSPKSAGQTKDYNASSDKNEQGRSKSQLTQKIAHKSKK